MLIEMVCSHIHTSPQTRHAHKFAALLLMGADFTTAWLRIATGEKDPRNLMIAFAIYRVVLIEFPINDHIDVSGVNHAQQSNV